MHALAADIDMDAHFRHRARSPGKDKGPGEEAGSETQGGLQAANQATLTL
jgi:hypothetical protein